MVDIDWPKIDRAHKALGGEGAWLVELRSTTAPDLGRLDELTTENSDEDPTNGGWFATPSGPMLFLEGLPDAVRPWLTRLASRLTDAGVEGSLTGGRTASSRSIAWARELMNSFYPAPLSPADLKAANARPHWTALLGYRSVERWWEQEPLRWTCGRPALDAAVGHAIDWIHTPGSRLQVSVDLKANFWVDPAAATTILASETLREYTAMASAYDAAAREYRIASTSSFNKVDLTVHSDGQTWDKVIAELRRALVSAPMPWLSVAMIAHRGWGSLNEVGAYGYRHGYDLHPHRWDEFTLDARGLQVLTTKHLEKAHDLSGWTTTRLDESHFLVEARDLGAWYARSLTAMDLHDPDLLDQARRDFGRMILTEAEARIHDMVGNPRFKSDS